MKTYWVTVPKVIEQTLLVEANSEAEARLIVDEGHPNDPCIDYVGFEVAKTMKATEVKEA